MNETSNNRGELRGTVAGIFALLAWSSSTSFTRSLTEQLGPLAAAAAIYLPAGIIAAAILLHRSEFMDALRMPRKYLFVCGGLFVIYMVAYNMTLGFAASREVAIQAGVINYLWPALTLVFSVPLLKREFNPWLLFPGILIALAGIFLSTLKNLPLSPIALENAASDFISNCRENTLVFSLAFLSAVSWALYSCLSRKFASDKKGNAIPIFLLAAGVVLLCLRFFQSQVPHVHEKTWLELAYAVLVPALAAYVAWDIAMRRGKIVMVVCLSYFVPLLSTIFACLCLKVKMGWGLWSGCAFVIFGAALSRMGVPEKMP